MRDAKIGLFSPLWSAQILSLRWKYGAFVVLRCPRMWPRDFGPPWTTNTWRNPSMFACAPSGFTQFRKQPLP